MLIVTLRNLVSATFFDFIVIIFLQNSPLAFCNVYSSDTGLLYYLKQVNFQKTGSWLNSCLTCNEKPVALREHLLSDIVLTLQSNFIFYMNI